MDLHDLEKLAHVVLRRVGLKWEWLQLLPGGGNDWQWTSNEWEKHTFPTRKEAEDEAAIHGGQAVPCKLPEEEHPLPPPPKKKTTPHPSMRPPFPRKYSPDRKWYGYGIDD
jgi:hypothetical protein